MADSKKPSLLVVELWGMGDLVIATPFLQAASLKYDVTLLAKSYAYDLQHHFWPNLHVNAFQAPWTAFRRKYRLLRWPWRQLLGLRRMPGAPFDVGLSARWDPRDHLLISFIGARRRLGFPRLKSQAFLTDSLEKPSPASHRYESWRVLGHSLGLDLPAREQIPVQAKAHVRSRRVLVHTGAGQPVRVWPLARYRRLVETLRSAGYEVVVACDPDQRSWWIQAGESGVITPANVSHLFTLMKDAGVAIGNDSGPCHLAAFCGVPTFTIFGPQLPEWFAPLHPEAQWLEGKPCPYKPCSDYCRFDVPYCIINSEEQEMFARVEGLLKRVFHST